MSSLSESIIEEAALEWFLLRQGCGGQVAEPGDAAGHRPQMAPGEAAAEREFFDDVDNEVIRIYWIDLGEELASAE